MTVAKTSHAMSEGVDTQDAQGSETNAVWFDPWLSSEHRHIRSWADNLTEAYAQEPRQRRMKVADRENLNAMLTTIVANLAYAVVRAGPPPNPLTFGYRTKQPPSLWIALRNAKQKQTRYDRPGFTGLAAMLERFPTRARLFILEKSHQKGTASRIILGEFLAALLYGMKLRSKDFAQVTGWESICLTRSKRDYVDGPVDREWVDYEDVPETLRYREEMNLINAYLVKADVRIEQDDGNAPVGPVMRPLRRYFNQPPEEDIHRFDLGGRLFGGWWQSLPRGQRPLIRIDGEPIADLDFSSMFLRLAYLRAGIEPPEGDLYAMIPGLSDPQWREGTKKIVSSLLFRGSPLTRVPRDLRDQLPPYMAGTRLRAAILAAHPKLAAVFEANVGLHLMFTESQILIATLLRLVDRRIPALPMHDGIMVARSKAGAAMEAMATASEEIVGMRLPITLK
jgi:hypothetical protein